VELNKQIPSMLQMIMINEFENMHEVESTDNYSILVWWSVVGRFSLTKDVRARVW